MSKLIYIANVSLDGYIEDSSGNFDWTPPSDEVFAFITDLLRPAGTYLYGRRLYETMAVWETEPALAAQSELMGEFARVWQAADKVVYSTTLNDVSTAKTRIERDFDPGTISTSKATATKQLTVGGANLAAHAFRAGLVDECSPARLSRVPRQWQGGAAERHARRSRAPRRAPVRQRCRLRRLPRRALTRVHARCVVRAVRSRSTSTSGQPRVGRRAGHATTVGMHALLVRPPAVRGRTVAEAVTDLLRAP